jgi:hypothetical protein
MKIKYPLCDFENEEGAKFCSNCNVPLIKPEAFDMKENPYIKKENKNYAKIVVKSFLSFPMKRYVWSVRWPTNLNSRK